MQIQTTKLANVNRGVAAQKAATTQDQQEPQAPQDSFGSTVKREALGEARHMAARVSNVTGGAGGLIGAGLGASAALVGGSIVGMAAGGAVAAPISSIFSSGGWNYIQTGLSSIGIGGQIGVGVGLVTLTAGGWAVGNAIGGYAAKPFAYGAGLATGAVKGTLRHLGQEAGALPPLPPVEKEKKEPIVDEKGPVMKFTKKALAGSGGLIGATGGATIGLAVGAGVQTLAGLFQGDLALSAITQSGLIGAGVGGASGLVVGMAGGMQIADMIHGVTNSIAEGSRVARTVAEQDKRDNLMDELRDRLEQNKSDFATERQAGDANITRRETALNARGERLTKDQQNLSDKLTNEDGLTDARSNELYRNETERLVNYEKRMDDTKAHLDSEKVRLTDKEGNIDNLIRQEADQRREAHRNAEQGKYDTRKGNLESREDQLQSKESNINQIAADKVKRELDPLRDQAANARSNAASNRRQADDLRSDARRMEGQVSGLLADATAANSAANIQESENSRLRSDVRNLDSRESSLESELRSCQAEKRRRDDARRRDDSRHGGGTGGGGRRDDSRHGGGSSGGRRSGSHHGGGTGSGRRSGSKWG